MSAPVVFDLGACRFEVWPAERYCRTVFPDGSVVHATPEDTDEYRATAERLGYGADTWRMCFEHELMHSMVSRAEGFSLSPVLADVAHGRGGSPAHAIEETKVMEFQRKLNACRSV